MEETPFVVCWFWQHGVVLYNTRIWPIFARVSKSSEVSLYPKLLTLSPVWESHIAQCTFHSVPSMLKTLPTSFSALGISWECSMWGCRKMKTVWDGAPRRESFRNNMSESESLFYVNFWTIVWNVDHCLHVHTCHRWIDVQVGDTTACSVPARLVWHVGLKQYSAASSGGLQPMAGDWTRWGCAIRRPRAVWYPVDGPDTL